jgi:hypothetical protein
MSSSGIGIPQIKPRHRAAWQESHPARDRSNDKDHTDSTDAVQRERAPSDPGTGKVVDKVV